MSGADDGTPTRVRIRRAPKIGVFLIFGGAIGALATLVVTSLFPADPTVGFAASYGYFLLYGIPAGLLLGAVTGILFDVASVRRARSVTVERELVSNDDPRAPEVDPEP